MPRKVFIADVTAAAEKAVPKVSSVVRGDDDGDVNFIFSPASGAPIEVGVLALDVAGYPSENTFMIFTKSSDVPKGVNDALEDLASSSAGMSILALLSAISQRLQKVLATGSQGDPLSIDDSSDVEMIDGDGEDESKESEQESEEEYFDYSDIDDVSRITTMSTYRVNPQKAAILNRRIKEDLRAVRYAGFKLGILSGMKAESQTSVLSISIQAAKLGLSEEALQAWDLSPQEYIVLLIRYADGYKSYESVIAEPAKSQDIAFRIGVCNKYKPTLVEALAAFTDGTVNAGKSSTDEKAKDVEQDDESIARFGSLFISSSLNEFVNEQFISLLKIRIAMGIGWDGAKRYFNDKQGRIAEQNEVVASFYYEESTSASASLLGPLATDHISDNNSKSLSFPLIAAQFSMRYFLRCTEFCLVCHDKMDGDFEALKPYVCSKPLCLYQYMSLGFGPSVEHEILTQPYVVDLLVSFCYAAALGRRLREYPTGMSLMVPPVTNYVTNMSHNLFRQTTVAGQTEHAAAQTMQDSVINSMDVKFDVSRQEIIFENNSSCSIHNGEWVVITAVSEFKYGELSHPPVHYRVSDTSLYPTLKLSEMAVTQRKSTSTAPINTNLTVVPATPATTPPPPVLIPAKMTVYDQNFDDMDDDKKAETIVMLLETLPTIKELRSYLVQQSRSAEPSLRTWKERISPAALGILRWIIASNRSCIVQVDKCPGQDDAELAKVKIRLDQKCSNVHDNYVQFRFAQGAPDKEQRFLKALKNEQSKLNPQYPTLFAFHGSPLHNWHSIIRHGLDFKETLHGRAYGHGVYHAQDQNTSVGYAGAGTNVWGGSELKIASAMSLNEIVNCPDQFQSSSPYLVVQHIDWIQCRYLLVMIRSGDDCIRDGNSSTSSAVSAFAEVQQDPKFTARTTLNKPIGVPQCAISVSRAFRASKILPTPGNKRRKFTSSADKLSVAETTMSDDEELEDLVFLFSDEDEPQVEVKDKAEQKLVILKSRRKETPKSRTDFVPGSLDQSTLPMLDPPSYATPSATMRLNRELRTILKAQESTPLHELGWHIDSELISNVYQWIVELHSFEPSLPLAKDMKAAGISSVVLEIRFGKDYPHSPPFVRVIRPRFLPFMSGGGGHVTGGGAMCMELLTNSGWSAVSSIESVLLQVRMAMMNLEPKPARLETQDRASQRDYGTAEAMDAYIRSCRAHGWQVPKDFQDFGGGGASSGH